MYSPCQNGLSLGRFPGLILIIACNPLSMSDLTCYPLWSCNPVICARFLRLTFELKDQPSIAVFAEPSNHFSMYLLTRATRNEPAKATPNSPSDAAKSLVIPIGARSPYPTVVKVMHE